MLKDASYFLFLIPLAFLVLMIVLKNTVMVSDQADDLLKDSQYTANSTISNSSLINKLTGKMSGSQLISNIRYYDKEIFVNESGAVLTVDSVKASNDYFVSYEDGKYVCKVYENTFSNSLTVPTAAPSIDVSGVEIFGPIIDTGVQRETYSYEDLKEIIEKRPPATTYLFEGCFGSFACYGGDASPIGQVVTELNLVDNNSLFLKDSVVSQEQYEAYFILNDDLVTPLAVMDYYCGRLVFGNSLKTVAEKISELEIYDVDTQQKLDVSTLDRTSLYCVYHDNNRYLIKNTGVYTGIIQSGRIWSEWRNLNNNAWDYDTELGDESVYRFSTCTFNSLGSVILINLEEV